MPESDLRTELRDAEVEPLLPIEKKLISWSLGIGLTLLVVGDDLPRGENEVVTRARGADVTPKASPFGSESRSVRITKGH
jgi:hypothetical protein